MSKSQQRCCGCDAARQWVSDGGGRNQIGRQVSTRLLYEVKRGFHPTQRTRRKERKERNKMTSLLDRPITAASDDGVCRWHTANLWQTRAKLLKLNLICIVIAQQTY